MKRYVWLLATGLLLGCQREGPTAEDREDGTVAPEAAIQASLAVEDALVRIVPALGEQAATGGIASALDDLTQALAAGQYRKSVQFVRAARQAIDEYQQASGADVADLDAIRLALGTVAEVIQ
jgi:hypothetical protein